MFYDDAYGLVRVLIVGTLAYGVLVIMLRVSGKRTLASMNAFDLVVTVALGSTVASVVLAKDVPLAEGVLAFLLLIALQYFVVRMSHRFAVIETLVKTAPRSLLRDGIVDDGALRAERVSRSELAAAVRKAGLGDFAQVAAVVLEADGTFSVIANDKAGGRSALP